MALDTRSLLVIGVSSALWAFSFGLGSQAVSHWLKDQNINDTVIGLNHSFYYFGLAAASFVVPVLTPRMGLHGAPRSECSAPPSRWFFFPSAMGRFIGMRRDSSMAAPRLSLIPLETLVSRESAPEHRTLNFGIYGVSLTVGGALGMALAPHLYPAGYLFAFHTASCPR